MSPARFRIDGPSRPDADVEELAALAGDRRRGAAEIARSVIDWCVWWAEKPSDVSAESVAHALSRVARAQAAMAPVLRIVNDLLVEIERSEGSAASECRRKVAEAAISWRDRLVTSNETLVLHLRRAFKGASTIYTYSASSSVAGAIEAHYEAGNWFQVVMSEGRPGGEGVELARRLAGRGIPVRLGTDMWLWKAIDEVGVFAVGADALLSTCWVNKLGTEALAARAKERGVGVVVAADTSKWLPPALGTLPRNYERDPEEIAPHSAAGPEVENVYFEEIPYSLLDQLVTERGPTRPRDLRIRDIQLARSLE